MPGSSPAGARAAIIKGAGHNLPQEAPQAFADAVAEVDGY
jgi:pimeloyl-ACP methyl ester carboxylesterase